MNAGKENRSMEFLNQNEVLMHTPYLVLVDKDAVPKTPEEVLQGIQTLWERIIEILKTEPEVLDDLEQSMNSSLEEAGAWERISLTDESYLDLLNPLIISGDGWGIAPKLFMEKLQETEVKPELYLTANDPEAKDPELPFDLTCNLLDPLYLPREYR